MLTKWHHLSVTWWPNNSQLLLLCVLTHLLVVLLFATEQPHMTQQVSKFSEALLWLPYLLPLSCSCLLGPPFHNGVSGVSNLSKNGCG